MSSEYITCDRCNGLGAVYLKFDHELYYCKKCRAHKQLNWLENLFGVPPDYVKDQKCRDIVYDEHALHENGEKILNYVEVEENEYEW